MTPTPIATPHVAAIRPAATTDAAALALVGAATFLESYAGLIPGPDLIAHVRDRHGAATYADWLADGTTQAWLAEAPAGAPLGYAVVTTPDLPADCVEAGDLEIRRIYLLGVAQGRGAGARLLAAVVAGAAAAGATRLTLGTHAGNARAIGFYRRHGFVAIGARHFMVGTQRYDDLVFGLRL